MSYNIEEIKTSMSTSDVLSHEENVSKLAHATIYGVGFFLMYVIFNLVNYAQGEARLKYDLKLEDEVDEDGQK